MRDPDLIPDDPDDLEYDADDDGEHESTAGEDEDDAEDGDDDGEQSPDTIASEDEPRVAAPEEPDRGWLPIGALLLEYRFWENPRSFTGLDDTSMAGLAESIRSGTQTDEDGRVYAGIRDALEVVTIAGPNATVAQLIIDGQRRFRAAQLAGMSKDTLVPVRFLESTPVTWSQDVAARYLARALESVGQRAQLSSYELAMSAARLRASQDPDTRKDYTLARIAAAVGRSESWVSKILTAIEAAGPKLLQRWKSGELTDEQFKDLARVKDPGQQDDVADRAAEARAAGGRGAARQLAKEVKAKESAVAPKPASTPAKPSSEQQQSLPPTPPRKPMPLAKLEDLLELAKATPPTHDMVRGILLGMQVAAGVLDSGSLPKPWTAYIERLYGAATESAPAKPDKSAKAKPAAKAKAKPPKTAAKAKLKKAKSKK